MKDRSSSETGIGTLAAFATYGMWGLFPLYWKQLKSVDPVQILCHRIVWALVFALLLLVATKKLGTLARIFRDRKKALAVAASGLLITANWGTYIWAVNSGHVAESSLGYYINPLLSVALGAIFFKERLDRWTAWAVGIATLGVAAASVLMGSPPWISLALASTFALYGAVKKKVGLGPVEGLAAETIVVAPFAAAWLLFEGSAGRGALGGPDLTVNVMLVVAGAVTAAPLLCFGFATNRITLQRLGFVQYLSPSLQLMLGLAVYRERLTLPLGVALASVVAAVLIYALSRGRAARAKAERP